tara:strand:+ start:169 stop:339 length:171 start_codon:yes stop_codon:yes gene_type:complete
MPKLEIEKRAKLVAIEYAGVGSLPHFIVEIDGDYKSIPVKTGVNLIDKNNLIDSFL